MKQDEHIPATLKKPLELFLMITLVNGTIEQCREKPN